MITIRWATTPQNKRDVRYFTLQATGQQTPRTIPALYNTCYANPAVDSTPPRMIKFYPAVVGADLPTFVVDVNDLICNQEPATSWGISGKDLFRRLNNFVGTALVFQEFPIINQAQSVDPQSSEAME